MYIFLKMNEIIVLLLLLLLLLLLSLLLLFIVISFFFSLVANGRVIMGFVREYHT